MCQTGGGVSSGKAGAGDGWEQGRAGLGAQVRVRHKPPALGIVSTWLNSPVDIPAPTEPVPGLLPLLPLPGMEYVPRQRIFRVQCRASSINSQTLNYCKVVVREMQPETFPFPVFQFISFSGSMVLFHPWLWNKENVF